MMEKWDVAITLQEDGYMVENSGVYFKVGKREGKILERIVNCEPVDDILRKEEITEQQLLQLIDGFKKHGVIGEPKVKKNSLLFYRIPLFESDRMFS